MFDKLKEEYEKCTECKNDIFSKRDEKEVQESDYLKISEI